MSTTATLDTYSTSTVDTDQPLQYRALHTGAIFSFVLGIFSVVYPLVVWSASIENSYLVALIPLATIVVSMWSWSRIRQQSDFYTGAPLAILGLLLSVTCLIPGTVYGLYTYATEVPDGYTRTAFTEMKPSEIDERGGIAIPKEIAALDGKRVFIKGYIRPDSITLSKGIGEFLLVRDNNQCCFGDMSKINFYDQMQVDMVGSRRVDYKQGIFRMGGILKIQPQNVGRGPLAPVYTLLADYAK
jgi:hypothetical protein